MILDRVTRKSWPMLLVVTAVALACSSLPTEVSVSPYDFFGAIVTYDLTAWTSSSGGHTVGGPSSGQRVGPAAFTLTDGTTVQVPEATRGGSLCDGLAGQRDPTILDDCVIIGELVDDTDNAAWFGILDGQVTGDEVSVSTLIGVQDGTGIVASLDEVFAFQLAKRVEYRCLDVPRGPHPVDEVVLPDAATHFAVIDLTSHEIVAVECGYSA